MAKGIELPVNVLVIIVIAVLVLIALATLVATGVLSMRPVQVQMEKNAACSAIVAGGCTADPATIKVGVDVGKVGDKSDDNFQTMCTEEFKATTPEACRALCGCKG
ncbi:MAG: hypothetical protein QXD77_00110 [Candidatus Aenigmatarchaeota archaeon]